MNKSLFILEDWKKYYDHHPCGHILQSPEWSILKADFGWEAAPIIGKSAGAIILFKKIVGGFTVGYIPKGPLGTNWDTLWEDIDKECKKRKTIFLKIEPDLELHDISTQSAFFGGLKKSLITIQPNRTIVINLQGGEQNWLKRMKQKTRYNVRLAAKKGVWVEQANSVDEFYELMHLTGKRENFGIHSHHYYQQAHGLFSKMGLCTMLIAKYEGIPLAGIMVFRRGTRAWYFYGASRDEFRHLMPAYILQNEAMKWAYQNGCQEYDLWGIPDFDEQFLEENFSTRDEGLWGVYRFKRGFGGEIRNYSGAWDKVYLPTLYWGLQTLLKNRGRF